MKNDVPVKFLYRVIDERGGEGSGLPLMSVSLTRGVVPRSDISESGGRADDLSTYKVCRPGDIVINRMSAYQGALGLSHQEGLVSPDYLVLRPNEGVSPSYLTYMFKSRWFVGEMTRRLRGIGSTEQGNVRTPRINSDELGLISIKIPTPTGQQTIADYLDRETARIDALVEKKKRMINSLDDKWSNKLREIVEVQPEVEVMQLRRCVEKIVSGNWGEEPGTADIDAICVRAGDFDFQTYSANRGVMRAYLLEDIKKSCLREGDLIIEKSGGGEESPVGRVVEWKSNEVAIPTNFAAGIRVNKRVLRKYLLYVFASCYSSRLTTRSIKQTTGIQNLDIGSYLSEKVPVPSLEIQEVIVERLDLLISNIRAIQNRLETQIAVLLERRQALITAAVTGELEIAGVAA